MQQELLNKTFQALKDAGINFLILRNYESLPSVVPDGDIDILIDRNDAKKINNLLHDLGFLIVDDLHPHTFALFYDTAGRWLLKLDIVDRLAFGTKIIMPFPSFLEREILSKKSAYKNFFVPAPVDEFLLLLLHCIGDKEDFKPEYKEKLQELISGELDQSSLLKKLKKIFGHEISRKIPEMLKEGRFAELIQLHALLRRFLAKNLQRTDLFFTFTILLQRIIRKFLGRKGLRIALLGPDGSGKSTLATLIQEKGMGPSVCVYMGRDQFIIPTRRLIKWLRSKIRKDRETSSKEVNPSPSSQLETLIPVRGRTRGILDVFRLFHDLADYYARYFFKNYLNCRKGFLVINDRYIYDMLSGSEKVQRLPVVQWIIMHLFPAPDYIFLLDAPVDAMYARKGEHTTELLTSMKEHILKLQDQLDNCYIIQTNRNPEDSANEIISHIWRAYFHNLAKH